MNDEEVKSIMKKAKAADAQSQYELGMIYYKGYGAYVSGDQAFKWFKKASKQGNKDARMMYKRMRDDYCRTNNAELVKYMAMKGRCSDGHRSSKARTSKPAR